ncbi:hypothetical protein B0H19DRAFT_1261702 [Mycena capillaripes]|nr:hypothetical protein B0H19DRAFT_1261702 [Mycena capillaripes]
MRCQRCSQPWQRFVLGFIATPDAFGLLRADVCGIEECIIARNTSRGVIEAIRLCLGLSLANDVQLGQDPIFTLRQIQTLARIPLANAPPTPGSQEDDEPEHNSGETTGSETPESWPRKRRRSSSACAAPVWPNAPYQSREISAIRLGDDPSGEWSHFHVHFMAYDSTPHNWFGRCTRVFCVSREMSAKAKKEYVAQNPDVRAQTTKRQRKTLPFYDGRFAMKMIYSDIKSEAYADDLQQEAQDAGVNHILFPDWVLKHQNVLDDLRGWSRPTFEDIRATAQTDRQLVISLSPFKWTLNQFQDLREVLSALRDVAQAVKELSEIGLLHRDISPGNILLAEDVVPSMHYEVNESGVFIRQARGAQSGGLLHDMDMCGRMRQPEVVNVEEHMSQALGMGSPTPKQRPTHVGVRTGTTPFMALAVLRQSRPHHVLDDIQSIFFVLYLFFFTSSGSALSFPNGPAQEKIRWPAAIFDWTTMREGMNHTHLATQKAGFFNNLGKTYPFLYVLRTKALPRWRNRDQIVQIIAKLYSTLWKPRHTISLDEIFEVSEDGKCVDEF